MLHLRPKARAAQAHNQIGSIGYHYGTEESIPQPTVWCQWPKYNATTDAIGIIISVAKYGCAKIYISATELDVATSLDNVASDAITTHARAAQANWMRPKMAIVLILLVAINIRWQYNR